MSRKDLEKFDPAKLKPGARKWFEVVNSQTGYHEVHYFCRDRDGELLAGVASNFNTAESEIKSWKKLKHAREKDLKQLSFVTSPESLFKAHELPMADSTPRDRS